MAKAGTQTERRKEPRRDQDKKAMARIKALEEEQREHKERQAELAEELNRHVTGCESAAVENKQDNAKIIGTQAEHGSVLKRLEDMLPWMERQYTSAKGWERFWSAAAEFALGMIRKNWEALSGKLLLLAVVVILGVKTGHEIDWKAISKLLGE